jgi:NTE family protein
LAKRKHINLALQGGGAHGAFTWGVLDHILERDTHEIGWVSGTSAGAINAVAMASGLAEGGKSAARAKLRHMWENIAKAGVPDFARMNPFLMGWTRSESLSNMARMFSPSELNPMGLDPLRKLLSETIDFDRLRKSAPVELMIAATDLATGRARIFRRHEITLDVVMASACLPTLHPAVVIDGRAYWDGGFSANPDLIQLALMSPHDDTIIVLLNPTTVRSVPTSVQEIAANTNRLTFNAPFLRDIKIIEAVRAAQGRGWLARRFANKHSLSPLAQHRYHLIEAGRHTSALPTDSKMRPDLGLFTYLHGAGRQEAYKWFDGNGAAIGRRATVDLKARFLDENPTFVPAEPLEVPEVKASAPLSA